MNEFDLIYQTFLAQSQTAKGFQTANNFAKIDRAIGDDCAVITPPVGQKLVICTDTLVQGRHFAGDWESVERQAFEIGYKSVAVNLSDLSAMGATPHSILLAIALPQRLANFSTENGTWLENFAKGLFFACDNLGETISQNSGVALIGGDTTQSDNLVITVTAQGFANSAIYRHTAQVGDEIFVSGTVGDASFALANLDNDLGKSLAHRLHLPTPRVTLGQSLLGVANSMIDISDGLVQDLGHILSQSGLKSSLNSKSLGARLDLDKLPTSEALSQVALKERLQFQMTGGDDYELLFTMPKGAVLPSMNVNVTKIGEITADNGLQLFYQNKEVTQDSPFPFERFPSLNGWSHF